jgi:hypothetical protein
VIGITGYALLLPAFVLGLYGVVDPTPGGSASILAVPVALWEIILMPIWLYVKGFNATALAAK